MKKSVFKATLCIALAALLFTACSKKNDNKENTQKPDGNNPIEDAGDGLKKTANDIWEGFSSTYKGEYVPKTTKATKEVFIRDYGIDEAYIEDYVLRTPEGENNASEFIIVHVKDGKMAHVEEALEKRKNAIAEQWKDSTDAALAYAREPMIYKSGNYIMLAVHSSLENAKNEFERLVK